MEGLLSQVLHELQRVPVIQQTVEQLVRRFGDVGPKLLRGDRMEGVVD